MYSNFLVILVLNIFYSEIFTTDIRCEPPDYFLCANKEKCISTSFRCDGENDCSDHSDEQLCAGFTISPNIIQCATDEFQCGDRSCIPVEQFCDAKPDCSDNSDEYEGCVKDLKCDAFRCNDGHCIRNEWVCDDVPDCPDKSDEEKCENRTLSIEQCNNKHGRYLCKNQRCIFLNATCDGRNDCGDNSDENFEGCTKADAECKRAAKCQHECSKTPEGAQCSCRTGYKLVNNRSCEDINECEEYGTCDQRCTNSAGFYTCSCQTGYILDEETKSCKADGGEALLLFSITSEIHGYYLDSKVYYPVTRGLQHAVAVSLDANYVYWSDIQNGDEVIIRSLEDGTQREVIVTTGLNNPDDIAVDWVTGNIYFTDSGYMHIGVCSNDGSYCSVIIKDRNDKPRALSLLPSRGRMYWTESGENAGILIAGMDGRNVSVLIDQNLEWPSSLSIDYANDRLYWIDSKLKVIESIRLDGTDRRTVLSGIAKKPFSLAVFENKLYWSDWMSNTIQSCDKFTGKNWKVLVNTNSTIYGIHIYHSVLKPTTQNPCNSSPCSQLCLLNAENNYTCACTVDKELNSDRHTCRAVKKKVQMVIAAGNTFINYYHELLGKPKMTASVTMKHVTAVAHNPLTGGLLASDRLTDKIFHFNTLSGELKSMMSIENKLLGGMDFDFLGNNLYFTDVEHRTIEVHSLSNNQKTIFYFQDEPHDITLIPEQGIMMAVFHDGGKYRIDMMRMNGLGARITIEGNKIPLFGPRVALCYDREQKRLFWSDQGTGRIGSTTIPGFETHIFRTGLSEPVSLAVLGDNVFWTEYKSNQLYWTSKTDTQQFRKRITLRVPNDLENMQLLPLHGLYVKGHPCRENNGNCSHVCLVSNAHSRICGCPPGMMLSANNRTCSPQTACNAGEVKCAEHDVCIQSSQRCNGVPDCPNGEDESSSCGEQDLSICQDKDQFQCKSGECVSKTKRCNSNYDCADRSDEEGCFKKECDSNEFQCDEGACISKYFVCDGEHDCTDLSDERNCATHSCDTDNFACDSGACIPETWKCDGEVDCPDRSDEGEMCQRNRCPSEMFSCSNGHCIDTILRCNGVDDCMDNSDEEHCAEIGGNRHVNCSANEYKCLGAEMCLPKRARCNGVQDCPKNDDERDCVRCEKGEYVCDNKKCINKNWVCDTYDDCGDGSDETHCDGSSNFRLNIVDNSDCKEFRCADGQCLPFDRVCDGSSDCMDQSDEYGQCETSCTQNSPCSNICVRTPTGPVCRCTIGYKLSSDSKSCEDVNECEDNTCSQLCYNTNGSFICSCHDGYVIKSDKTSCKVVGPQMNMITVTGTDIRKISQNLKSIEIIHEELNSEISGIDVNTREESFYWSNDILGMISEMNMETRKRKTVTGLGRPEALAVDWITNNVYFNDNDHFSTIKVCNLEEQKCAKVASIGTRYRGVAIAIDPRNGWLFWSQTSWAFYDKPTTEIYRSGTSGTNRTVIVSQDIGVALGMAIDYLRSRLYWTDTVLKTIESSNFDGSNRMQFLDTDVHQALSISIHEDSLFWLAGTTGMIKKCKLYGDKSCTSISIGSTNINKHFTILHTTRQPMVKNACENHKCSYMCILENNEPVCICHNGRLENRQNGCVQNMNTNIKFAAHTASRKGEISHQQSGTLTGIIIAVLVCIAIGAAYFYYQKMKPTLPRKNNLSIHFQNPSYDQQNDFGGTINCISGLPPGEHEYINPIMQMQKNCNKNNAIIEKTGNEKQVMKILNLDRSDDESEKSAHKQDMLLIR